MRTNCVTYEPNYNGLPIQARPGFGLRTEILEVLHGLFSQTIDRVDTFAVVMLDIRGRPGGFYTDGNRVIKRFSSRFSEHLRLQGIASDHVWVRKHPEYSSEPHYVEALLLDACYSENLDLHLAHANGLWAQETEVTQRVGLIHYCELDGASRAEPVLIVRIDGPGFHGSYGRSFRTLSRIAHVETSADESDDTVEFGSSLQW